MVGDGVKKNGPRGQGCFRSARELKMLRGYKVKTDVPAVLTF
jgi:hypothetical protein